MRARTKKSNSDLTTPYKAEVDLAPESEQDTYPVDIHEPEPEPGQRTLFPDEVDTGSGELDEIRQALEEEKERIKRDRAAAGKTGRPGKSQKQRELEEELASRTTTFAGGAARATAPGPDAEQMFLGFDTLTPDTIINIFDMAQVAVLQMLNHPAPETLPLSNAEKKAIKPPLTAYLNEQAVQLTPGAALMLTMFSVMAVRVLPVAMQKYQEYQDKKARKARIKTV